jgi:hypothetical protein
MFKYQKPKEKLLLDFNIKDDIKDIIKDTLLVITNNDMDKKTAENLIENLNGNKKRDWFVEHAYFCLPLTIGNQHGFIVKAAYDFSVFWDGGNHLDNVIVKYEEKATYGQIISSHFGMGTFTIQNPWMIRTPKNVNLLVMNPPNFYIDGIIHMTACIETDNLRRDFTFNLKITRPKQWINIKKGTPIGYMLPYPRYFIDNFTHKIDEEGISREIIEKERSTAQLFGKERSQIDSKYRGGVGGRYMRGEDIYGNQFEDHQKNLNGCPFGFGKK